MTNGEKIKEVFPSIELYEKSHDAIQINFDSVWWNAEYKEPTTKNDLGVDCIDRAEVLKLMQDNWHTHNGDWAMQESMDDIRALPSVTPQEPRKGHWITQWNVVHQKEYYYCSECREEFSYDGETGIKMNDYNFCPNCGARMFEPQESEDEG